MVKILNHVTLDRLNADADFSYIARDFMIALALSTLRCRCHDDSGLDGPSAPIHFLDRTDKGNLIT